MSDLRARATQGASPRDAASAPVNQPVDQPVNQAGAPEPLEVVDAPEGIDDDPADVPVHIAVARAMRDLGKIAKADRFEGGNAGKYNFRGVDRVVNAVAPVLRKHGIIVVPQVDKVEYRDVPRANSGRSHECVVTVCWQWVGPRGDSLEAVTMGEALDTADKATSKAQSVAWRTCLIQMLAIPTGDPDPDSVRIERGDVPVPTANGYRDEIVHPDTSLGRLRQIRTELAQHQMAGRLVIDNHGDEVALGALVDRIGLERRGTTNPNQ